MNSMEQIGRFFLIAGIAMIAIGGILMLSGKISWLGRLPGDIVIQKNNFTFYFPIATSILLSILLTFIFWLLGRK